MFVGVGALAASRATSLHRQKCVCSSKTNLTSHCEGKSLGLLIMGCRQALRQQNQEIDAFLHSKNKEKQGNIEID